MGNNLVCCCKGDYVVSGAEIKEDHKSPRNRTGRIQNQ